MHYFFESPKSMHSFFRNLAECTRIGGYFVGTCYDGQTVFNVLKNKKREESMTIMREDKKIYEITKQYDQTGFPEDEMSLGYAIDVYQESINKVFREYLVNFKYVERVLENYGFVVLPEAEAKAMGLPAGSGLFDQLFDNMNTDVSRDQRLASDYGTAADMTPEEKRISFMNRYFVFKKMRSVNAEKVGKMIMNKGLSGAVSEAISEAISEAEEADTEGKSEEKVVPIARKVKGTKIVLEQFSPSEPTVSLSASAPLGAPLGKTVKIKVQKPPAP
jgi:hypothetical protein